MIYGYARVSTDGQTLDAQREALAAAGASKVFAETEGGAKTDRAQLAKLLTVVQAGDVVLVTRLDWLARSTRDLLNILATIDDRGAAFRSLADTWADTSTPHGRLMVTILGGLAEFERSLIQERTTEGRTLARARGQTFGRRPKLTTFQQQDARACRLAGESIRETARSYNVSASTISRMRVSL
jgi:DNA invertase Pin-like site-specific DNA recombinase